MTPFDALALFLKLVVIAAWVGVIGTLVGITLGLTINSENEGDER